MQPRAAAPPLPPGGTSPPPGLSGGGGGRADRIHGNQPAGRAAHAPGVSWATAPRAAISVHASPCPLGLGPGSAPSPPGGLLSFCFLRPLPPLLAGAGTHAVRAASLPPPAAVGAAGGLGPGGRGVGPPWPLKRGAATCPDFDGAAPGLPGSWGGRRGDSCWVRGRWAARASFM